MIELPVYPTGRPCWIDPDKVGAITDAMEMQPPRIAGGQPMVNIVGTQLAIDGVPVIIAMEIEKVAPMILKARKPRFDFAAV